jgi:AcrR family transcriptional regulator
VSTYHHGDLRRAVIDGALEEIAARGPSAVSLRAIARRAGVSHAAPAHHFGDKAGVLTAIAAEGYRGLAEALARPGDILALGRAYVRFALEHRAHFEVMFRPELYAGDDPEVTAARDAAAEALFGAVRDLLGPDATEEEIAGGVTGAWSFAHGLATLWLNGNITPELVADPDDAFRLGLLAAARLANR